MGTGEASGRGLGAWIASMIGMPLPTLIILAGLAVAIWRVLDWRYKAQIEALEHRLKLRDDQIGASTKQPATVEQTVHYPLLPDVVVDEPITPDDLMQTFIDKLHETQEEDRRIFIAGKTAAELMAEFDNTMSRDVDNMAKRYLGKWLRVSLPIVDIIPQLEETTVTVRHPTGLARFIWLHFREERERLDLYGRGETINAVGRVRELSAFRLRLYACEIAPDQIVGRE